ncbi:MAG: tRNA pseudouridine(54/55) synthase Pus10 [Thermoplasmata archaeon]|nr:MAG: tRNA pseudouridine(54/55) synthase Pus10 [Thermoplasmata archaeon]
MEISDLVDLDLAEKAASKGLCYHCLGRQFAKHGHGMSNKERGFYLRNALISHLADESAKQKVVREPSECWLCSGLFNELPKFSEIVIKKLDPYQYDTFLIGSKIDAEIMDREERLWGELGNQHYEPIKAEINREVGKLVEAKVKKTVNFENPDITAVIDTRFDSVELQITPLFLYGRYKKLIRGIPQTRWDCKDCWGKGCEKCNYTGKMYDTSIEEIIAKVVMDDTKGADHSFHGMGREDIDARMLGNGRPFILEIKIPIKRHLELKKLEKRINLHSEGMVEVSDIRKSSKEEVVAIKDAKVLKTYDVEVEFAEPIKHAKLKEVVRAFKDRTIEQKTPKRVLHRRADKTRKRMVKDIDIETVDDKKAKFTITGESGIYVKELVHGDEGRTKPSIAEYLDVKCNIKTLDVMHIHDEDGGK